jgi:hypothetical protein
MYLAPSLTGAPLGRHCVSGLTPPPFRQVKDYTAYKVAEPEKWVRGLHKLRDAMARGETPLIQSR